MLIKRLATGMKAWVGVRSTRSAAVLRSRRSFRPGQESLEDRKLLSASLAGDAERVRHAAIVQSPAETRQARNARYQATVEQVLAEYHAPGAVVGVWVPGKGAWVKADGLADVSTQTPMSVKDHFPIRSITKSFTVTALLQLVRAHRVSLTDPISKYVPGIPNGRRISLAMLAGMSSGVQDYTDSPAFLQKFVSDFSQGWTARQLVDAAIPGSPKFTPGAQYDYSNTNTVLLGMVINRVTGRPLAATLQKQILGPLGLSQTKYLGNTTTIPSPHATPYEVDPDTGVVERAPAVNFSAFGASGAMVTTIRDLHKWGLALGSGQVVGPSLQRLREAISRPATSGPEYDRYGLGIGEINGWWGHSGDGLGFQAATFYQPKTHAVIAVLMNSSQSTNVPTQIFKALAAEISTGG